MTKSKSKKGNKPKTTKKEVKIVERLKESGRSSKRMPGTAALAKSLAMPFDYSSCVPDGTTGVGCFSVKQQSVLSTGAGGSCVLVALGMSPDKFTYTNGTTPYTAAAPNIGSNWVSASANVTISNMYSEYRTISGGIRATYVGNTQTDGGIVLAGRVAGNVPLSSFNSLTINDASKLFLEYEIFPLRNGAEILYRPEGFHEMENFWPLNGVQSATAATNTAYLLLIVYGANASQNILNVELIANFEGMFKDQTFLGGGISAKEAMPAEPGWYETARDMIAKLPAVVPFVSSVAKAGMLAVSGNYAGALGTLANGFLAPSSGGRSYLSGPQRKLLTM